MAQLIDYNELPEIVRNFASYKTGIQGCSQKTVDEYMLDLRTFFRFLLARRDGISVESEDFLKIDIREVDIAFIRGIGKEQIYEFLMYSGNVRKNLWAARSRKLSAIKGFYKYLTVKCNLLESNPAIDIEAPKNKKTLPKVMSLGESISLLDAIKSDGESKTQQRDLTIVTLFLNCGMRLSELVGLNYNDLDPELRSMRVIGKGSKERIIYLNSACRESLSDYLQLRLSEPLVRVDTKALFLSARAQRISVKTVQWMVYKYLDAAGLEAKHYSVHKLRHTAATLMYQSGKVDVRVLKDILGHEQLNTTQIYTHVSNKNMEDAMEQNPLAAFRPTEASKSSDPETDENE